MCGTVVVYRLLTVTGQIFWTGHGHTIGLANWIVFTSSKNDLAYCFVFGRQNIWLCKLVSIKALALQNGLLPQGPAAKWIHTYYIITDTRNIHSHDIIHHNLVSSGGLRCRSLVPRRTEGGLTHIGRYRFHCGSNELRTVLPSSINIHLGKHGPMAF